ncbi:hypothetical protein S7711_01852 [Stachybotrys chartarum IBT 7711]|uniref:Uncharacterized protein n=1 Tax=Stachybotrys chartarum (strain CBS 109288 / IBT 7711) TaxID=1280523 RepID=A0A084AJ62_STACB|nr:hypothetical protein S7711_01852 [Stachybotrys chartarum IBT 7711]KFA47513.1 hypothetical protein S40293_02171 [Stachybotrys chartarum IBT 40293]
MPRLNPVEKLPLAVRKNIRDEWESKKGDLETQLSELLGESWTLEASPNALFPYGEEGSYARQSTGAMIYSLYRYFESGISQLKYFVERHGDNGKTELNTIASAHVITIDYDDEKRFTYNGCAISPDGKLVILFEENNLAVNIYDALSTENVQKALNSAPTADASALSFVARSGISADYEAEIGPIQEKINKLLGKEITLEPGFDDLYAQLKAAASSDFPWQERNIGNFVHKYFNALADALEYQKFGEDEMLQEGFNEGVESGKVAFRLVDKSKLKASYNESVVEDGVLYMQTVPEYFGTNIDSIAANLIDLL